MRSVEGLYSVGCALSDLHSGNGMEGANAYLHLQQAFCGQALKHIQDILGRCVIVPRSEGHAGNQPGLSHIYLYASVPTGAKSAQPAFLCYAQPAFPCLAQHMFLFHS